MICSLDRLTHDTRGNAAVEFALGLSILMVLLAGLVDYSLAFWTKGLLTNSVSQGIQFALLSGPQVSTSSVRGIVSHKLHLSASDVDVSQPICKCVSGMPVTAVLQTCGLPCPNGALPGAYITISARYTYVPIMPAYSRLSNPVITETATAKLK